MKNLLLLTLLISGSAFAEYQCFTKDLKLRPQNAKNYDLALTNEIKNNCDVERPHSIEIILGAATSRPHSGKYVKICCQILNLN